MKLKAVIINAVWGYSYFVILNGVPLGPESETLIVIK